MEEKGHNARFIVRKLGHRDYFCQTLIIIKQYSVDSPHLTRRGIANLVGETCCVVSQPRGQGPVRLAPRAGNEPTVVYSLFSILHEYLNSPHVDRCRDIQPYGSVQLASTFSLHLWNTSTMASTEELRPNARQKSGTSITSEYEMHGFAHEDLEFSEGDKYFVCHYIPH